MSQENVSSSPRWQAVTSRSPAGMVQLPAAPRPQVKHWPEAAICARSKWGMVRRINSAHHLQFLWIGVEDLAAVLGDQHQILDTHPQLTRQIDARLD